jgi:SAM-dependent methyltransferase
LAYNHQHLAFNRLSRFTRFEGQRILEIGGNQSAESAAPFIEAGAVEVIVSGLDHVQKETHDSNGCIQIVRADAHKLKERFGARSFDVVYGLSIIEHIPMLPHFLEQVFQVLKPGGFAFFEGDPVWTSPRGHHVWVPTPTGRYFFSQPAGSQSINPVPDWGHLLMDSPELAAAIRQKYPDIPEADVEAICRYIYAGPSITRLSHHEIAMSFSNSPLVTLHMVTNGLDVPPAVATELRRRHGPWNDYGISAMQYVLWKPH